MKIFLGTSFSSEVDDEGVAKPEFKNFLETILAELRKQDGWEVFCAFEHEGWKFSGQPPEIGVRKDLSEVDSCDVAVFLTHDKPSLGAQFEFGYAVSKGKKTIMLRKAGDKLPYFDQGVVSGGLAKHVSFENNNSLINQLIETIK